MQKKRLDIWIPAAVGILGLAYLLFIAGQDPNPSPFAEKIYITVLALSSAAFAALIPGLLNVRLDLLGVGVRAVGGMAIFVLVLYADPITERLSGAVGIVQNTVSTVEPEKAKYAPEFSAVSGETNGSFDLVKASFEKELKQVSGAVASGSAEDVTRLIEHYVNERTKYYSTVRIGVSQKGSATKGSKGGRKRAPLAIACPANMVFEESSLSLVKEEGGCYGPTNVTASSAHGLVSQTGKGRSACTLQATCRFNEEFVRSSISQERALLTNSSRHL